MSLAVKFGDSTNPSSLSGAVYFSAVTQYSRSYGGEVTKHPIEAGAMISDHFISRNSVYTFSGVVSHVDFSNIPSLLDLSEGGNDFQRPINDDSYFPTEVTVNNADSIVSQILKATSLGTYIPIERATVNVDQTERFNHYYQIENLFESIITGLVYNQDRKKWENQMITATLFELDGAKVVRPVNNLVCTSCVVNESVDTGEELFLELTFERVTFVTLQQAEAPKPAPRSSTEIGTKEKTNKGSQASTTDSPTNVPQEKDTAEAAWERARTGIGGSTSGVEE